jgi:hypothetical protein
MKALHNKWAFWLDSMSVKINDIYTLEDKSKADIFEEFQQFEQKMLNEMKISNQGIQGFIDEHGELIKLIKYNLEQGQFNQARSNCEAIISLYGDPFSAFAYYYGAMAKFEAKKKGGKVMSTWTEKREAAIMLKKAIFLFERDIDRIQMRSYIMACIRNEKLSSGIGTEMDYFTRSNINEISAIQVHLNAAKSAITKAILPNQIATSLSSSTNAFSEEEQIELIEYIINHQYVQNKIKKPRISKKIKVKFHVDNSEQLASLLDVETYDKGIENAAKQLAQNLNDNNKKNFAFIIIENINEKLENKLVENGIEYKRVLYLEEIIPCFGYKIIEIPSQFDYCASRVLKHLWDGQGNKDLNTRINAYDKLLKNDLLSKERIWKLLNNKDFIIESKSNDVKYYFLNMKTMEEKEDETNKKFWPNEVFY